MVIIVWMEYSVAMISLSNTTLIRNDRFISFRNDCYSMEGLLLKKHVLKVTWK